MRRKEKFFRRLEIINWYDYFFYENCRPVWVTLSSLSTITGKIFFHLFPVLVVFMENMCKKYHNWEYKDPYKYCFPLPFCQRERSKILSIFIVFNGVLRKYHSYKQKIICVDLSKMTLYKNILNNLKDTKYLKTKNSINLLIWRVFEYHNRQAK